MLKIRSVFIAILIILISACQPKVIVPAGPVAIGDETPLPSPSVAIFTVPTITTATPDDAGIGDIHIYCGDDLQLLGTMAKDASLTLLKANGLEYYNSGFFLSGELVGEVLVASEIKGTNLRLQNNTFTQSMICYVGVQTMQGFIGSMLTISQLLNDRNISEQFEGSILIEIKHEQYQIDWLTYRVTSSSKKSCILYKIIQDNYPCNQDCSTIETEPGCECFCANFLYYDENCIPTEINPDCICVCREDGASVSLSTPGK